MEQTIKATLATVGILAAWAAASVFAKALFGFEVEIGATVPVFGFIALVVLLDVKHAVDEISDSLACEIDRRGEEDGEQSERESERS